MFADTVLGEAAVDSDWSEWMEDLQNRAGLVSGKEFIFVRRKTGHIRAAPVARSAQICVLLANEIHAHGTVDH